MFFNCLFFKTQVFKKRFFSVMNTTFLLKLFHILLNGLKTQFYLRSRNVTNYLQRQYILVPLPCGLYTGNIMIITSSNHSLKKRFLMVYHFPFLTILLVFFQKILKMINKVSTLHYYDISTSTSDANIKCFNDFFSQCLNTSKTLTATKIKFLVI